MINIQYTPPQYIFTSSLPKSISIKYDFYKGTRRMKLLDSNEIRTLRDACVFEVNGVEVCM